MTLILFIIYIIIFIFLIIKLIKCLKNKTKWIKLFIFEIISTLLSSFLFIYYDNLPGYGLMPGLSYFGETLISFGAMVLYGIILVITAITKLIMYLSDK